MISTLSNVDFVDGSFSAQFYMWWISPDPTFQPFEVMQILNGRQWTVHSVSRRTLNDGRTHTSGLVSATINHSWKLRRFPFDEQQLRLVFETPFPASELKIVARPDNALLSDLLHIEGFTVSDLKLSELTERYSSNFGLGAKAEDFSRLIVELSLKRQSSRFFLSLLVGFIAANIIALLTYAIHVAELSIRISMAGSAIFAAIGNMYYMNSTISPAGASLLIDMLTVVSFVLILLAITNSIIVERLMKRRRSGLAHKVNRMAFYGALIFAALAYGWTASFLLTTSAA